MKERRILVCIKPVPDPEHYDEIRIDPTSKTLVRSGIPAVINPNDKNAIEAALKVREYWGGTVELLSMAPPDAEDSLREGLAMGADKAYLLSDRSFAGSDTLATARVLAAGVEKIGSFDLVITGSESADGGTTNVSPQLGEMLGLPHVCNVESIKPQNEGQWQLNVKIEEGYMEVEGPTPMVIGVNHKINTPRYTTVMGIMEAEDKEVVIWSAADLGIDNGKVGLTGSPTQPGGLHEPKLQRAGELLEGEPEVVVDKLIKLLRQAGVLNA